MDAKEPLRSCSRKEKAKELGKQPGGRRQICVAISREEYDAIWHDAAKVRLFLTKQIASNPELFPENIQEGYWLAGLTGKSKKQPDVRLRQLVTRDNAKWYLRPSFVTPYMTARTKDIDKPLLLIALGVPKWAMVEVFGRNEMYWYRIVEQLGRNSLVGTTVQTADQLPEHLAADEHHVDWAGKKGYVAMTASQECLLGLSLTDEADETHLRAAYEVFAQEAQDLKADYQPKSVNTDGWSATQNAFLSLFSQIVIILCFLHGFLKVRDRCSKEHELHRKIWEVYRAASKPKFLKALVDLKTWFSGKQWKTYIVEMTSKLWKRVDQYAVAYDQPGCYRTSNQVDRPMNRIKRVLYAGRGLHGHRHTSERYLRGIALLNNFRPFAPRSNLERQSLCPIDSQRNSTQTIGLKTYSSLPP